MCSWWPWPEWPWPSWPSSLFGRSLSGSAGDKGGSLPAAIRTYDLTKYYGRARGIEGLDLEVARGEVFGFLGPNGAGKTTTFSCLYLNPRKALMASGLLTAGMYFLHFLGPSLNSLGWAQKLSLFYYYQPLPALLQGELHLWGMGLYVLVAIAGIGAGLAIFQRRDIVLG